MKYNPIKLYDMTNISEGLQKARTKATVDNINLSFGKEIISRLVSPDTGEKYEVKNDSLVSKSGKPVSIVNGIPDFTAFSENAWDEKNEQASFHDDEERNERFDEIVLRPFNYNKLHAKVWLGHLYEVCAMVEKKLGKSIHELSVLNCGCGGGFEAQFFAEQGAKVTGFDISQLRVEAASTRFALNNLQGFFYRGDAAILPFGDNTFDLVIYHDSLHHVPIEEIPKAVREACRVAKFGVVLSEAHDSPFRLLLESLGLSTSIESSGNYTFRFRPSLIEFWSRRYGMKLSIYATRFMKKEHRPKIYRTPVVGNIFYHLINVVGFFLRPIGNEAFILMTKR